MNKFLTYFSFVYNSKKNIVIFFSILIIIFSLISYFLLYKDGIEKDSIIGDNIFDDKINSSGSLKGNANGSGSGSETNKESIISESIISKTELNEVNTIDKDDIDRITLLIEEYNLNNFKTTSIDYKLKKIDELSKELEKYSQESKSITGTFLKDEIKSLEIQINDLKILYKKRDELLKEIGTINDKTFVKSNVYSIHKTLFNKTINESIVIFINKDIIEQIINKYKDKNFIKLEKMIPIGITVSSDFLYIKHNIRGTDYYFDEKTIFFINQGIKNKYTSFIFEKSNLEGEENILHYISGYNENSNYLTDLSKIILEANEDFLQLLDIEKINLKTDKNQIIKNYIQIIKNNEQYKYMFIEYLTNSM